MPVAIKGGLRHQTFIRRAREDANMAWILPTVRRGGAILLAVPLLRGPIFNVDHQEILGALPHQAIGMIVYRRDRISGGAAFANVSKKRRAGGPRRSAEFPLIANNHVGKP
jgi:hypothetical protein